MANPHSRLTSQGQISVPAEIRKKLGVGPGAVIEWEEQDDRIVVRRAGRYTSEDVHAALFPREPGGRGTVDIKEAIRKAIRRRHARG